MSIRTALNSGIENGQRDLPFVQKPIPAVSASSYTRPADWPALPSMTSSDSKFLGLLAVTNDTSNYIALSATTGTSATAGTGYIGNGTGVSTTGVYFSPPNNTFAVGMLLTGTGVTANTVITGTDTCVANIQTAGASTTLIVNSVTTGTVLVGMGGTTAGGAFIISQISGTTGGAGSYQMSGTVNISPSTQTLRRFTVNNSQSINAVSISGAYPYIVDWGDGSSPVTVGSGTIAQYQYNYSTLSSSVTSRGYKTAIVTVTVPTGNLLNVNLQQKYVLTATLGTLNAYVGKWLDISLGSPTMTSCNIGGNTTPLNMLEQVSFYGAATSATTIGTSLFANCYYLQSVPVLNLPPAWTSAATMFQNCYQLKNPPVLPSTSVVSGITLLGMFQNCRSLEYVPDNVFTNVNGKIGGTTATSDVFAGCITLREAPMLVWYSGGGASTSMSSMFSNCYSLVKVPPYNTTYVNSMQSTFSNCRNLATVPFFNTSNVTNTSSMFSNCFSLVTVPSFNLSVCTSPVSMFVGCSALKTIPSLFMPVAQSLSGTFSSCPALISVGTVRTGTSLAGLDGAFSNCTALETAPNITNTTNVTTTAQMFSGCQSLKSVPTYDTSNVTNMASMFTNCYVLVNIPLFNTIKVTTMAAMFQGCWSVQTIPVFNTGNVLSMQSMFNGANGLQSINFTDTTKLTNMSLMFSGCITLPTEALTAGAPNSWNTSNLTDLSSTFVNCSLITTIPTFNTVKVTTMNSMLNNCTNLVTVPALNMSNVTNSLMFSANPTLSNYQPTGTKTSISFSGAQMSKTALENVFLNGIIANTTSQTITITTNPGTDTPVVRTSGTANSLSNSVPFSNTVGITTGMIAYATGYTPGNKALTINVGTANISGIGANLAPPVNNKVGFLNPTSITNITANTVYYVVNSNADGNFQVSSTLGGSAITFTGTTSLVSIKIPLYVQSVVANTSVVLSSSPYTTTATSVSFRTLDMGAAFIKNWTVTG